MYPETVTPLETSVVALPLIAQILKLYWLVAVKLVTVLLVPDILASEIVVPVAQSEGAVAPVWYEILYPVVDPPPEVQLKAIDVEDAPDAVGLVGLGGAACNVVFVTVTPVETSGVALEFIAQTLKLY